MKVIQRQMIEADPSCYDISYKNYKTITFSDFLHGSSNYNNESCFVHREGIGFEDPVGCKWLTGNELLYYPALAKEMREIKEYPTLTRAYKMDKEIKGMEFLDYFYHRVQACYKDFRKELVSASTIVNHLIHLHGNDRYMPLIDRIEIEAVNESYKRKMLVIQGIKWQLDNRHDKFAVTEWIDLYRFLNISQGNFRWVHLEDAIPGTPFIALRIAKTYAHKGHVNWYNLDTKQKVSKADISRWKTPV